MRNVMIDLETMSTQPNAAILSIGAVMFGREGLGDEFEVNVDLKSCQEAGLHIDATTVMWWLRQSEEARASLQDFREPLPMAIVKFESWLTARIELYESKATPIVWGNGADFDPVILRNAYAACGFKAPWPYHSVRCYRTVSQFFPKSAGSKPNIAHKALDDARFQAQRVVDLGILTT